MPLFSKFVDGLLISGGVLVAGVACLYLSNHDYFPSYMQPVSYGIAFSGLAGLIGVQHLEEDEDEDDDPTYASRMAEFYRLKPQLEAHLREQAIQMLEFERLNARYKEIDKMAAESRRFGELMNAYDRTAQARGGSHDVLINRSLQRLNREIIPTRSLRVQDIKKLSKYY